MNSIFKNPYNKPQLGRNGFDISQRRQFSCQVGQLLPCYKDFAYVGDKYKINDSTFIRTDAVETSAFIELVHHLDWFFVPIQQLYMFWSEFFFGTQDVMSTFGVDSVNQSINPTVGKLPTLGLYNLMTNMTNFTTGDDSHFVTDDFGVPLAWNAARLMDMLEYGNTSTTQAIFAQPNGVSANFFPMFYLAYHKIFHSHYLNTDYFKNDPLLYNVDSSYNTSTIPDLQAFKIVSTLHYRPYRKDLFTNIKPAPIFDGSFANSISQYPYNTLSVSPGVSHLSYDSVNSAPLANTKTLTTPSSPTSGFPNGTLPDLSYTNSITSGISGNSTFSIGNIRSMFALDRLARITANSGSHYEDQVRNHFGFDVPQGIAKEAYFLGSHETPIIISEVVATASTTAQGAGNTLGDIAGKGFTPRDMYHDDIDFTCPSDGIIMGISSIEPLCNYASNRVDIENRYLTVFDFFKPSIDNLGMQPFWDAFNLTNKVGIPSSVAPVLENFVGWQTRWTEAKTKPSLVHQSMFATFRNNWVGYKESVYYDGLSDFDTVISSPSRFQYFYICPQYTNNIFLRKVPNNAVSKITYNASAGPAWKQEALSPENIYQGDSFLVNMHCRVYKTSVMSVHSLPKYI